MWLDLLPSVFLAKIKYFYEWDIKLSSQVKHYISKKNNWQVRLIEKAYKNASSGIYNNKRAYLKWLKNIVSISKDTLLNKKIV